MTEKSSQDKPIFGFTGTETVKLDLDNMSIDMVKYWAFKAMKQFKLGEFIILQSSKDCYHVVFDQTVCWTVNVGIVAWVCLMTKHRKLTEWLVMQLIKHASTLRVSCKKQKSSPRLTFRHGKQDRQIQNFLNYRKQIKQIIKKTEINY